MTLIVPFAAGGTTDIGLRALAAATEKHLGQSIVIENRSGAGGVLGPLQMATNSAPDGYTVAQIPITVFRYPFTRKTTFDPINDLSYILSLSGYTFGIVVKKDAPWATFQDFIADAKANPGKISYGTPGAGTTLHLTMEQIAKQRDIKWTHVPFRGTSESTNALLGGHISAVADASGWAPLVDSGQLRLLQPLPQDRPLGGRVVGPGARHDEDLLAQAHAVFRRAGLGVAAIAARRLVAGGLLVIGRSRSRGRPPGLSPRPWKCCSWRGNDLPVGVLGDRHPPGAEGRAIGQRLGDAVERRLDVIGGAVAMLHGHDDGRAAEGAVAGGEDLGVGRAHRVPVGAHAVAGHQARATPSSSIRGLLADRHDDHAAIDVVLAAGHVLGPAAAVLAGLAQPGLDAAQREAVALGDDRDRLGVVDDLDFLGDGALELVLARRDLLGAAAIEDLDPLVAGQPAGDAAGIHGDVAAADHEHRLRHRRPLAAIHPAQEADAVDHPGIVVARDAHGLAPPRADGQQHRIVARLELVERDVAAERRS